MLKKPQVGDIVGFIFLFFLAVYPSKIFLKLSKRELELEHVLWKRVFSWQSWHMSKPNPLT